MASTLDFDAILESDFFQYMKNVAYKFRGLEPMGAEELFSQFLEKVWPKAVDQFDPTKSSVKEEKQAFAVFLRQKLQQYLQNLSRKSSSGAARWDKSIQSLTAYEESLGNEPPADDIIRMSPGLAILLEKLPENKKKALEYLIANYVPGKGGEVLQEIKEKFGITRRELQEDQMIKEFLVRASFSPAVLTVVSALIQADYVSYMKGWSYTGKNVDAKI